MVVSIFYILYMISIIIFFIEELTLDNVTMIAKQLQNISEEALVMLAEKLGLSRQDFDYKGWRLILAMFLEWESAQAKKTPTSCEAGSKKQFARILYKISCELPESEASAELFKKVARAIDMTGIIVYCLSL